jgi:beta-lactamase superfamily II metal-dependent hydrolase
MFRIEMLQASEGDCLILSYGNEHLPQHVVIDGGRMSTWKRLRPRLEQILARGEGLELLVITHIDRDHIEGVLGLMEDPDIPRRFSDIWFNGYHHLRNERVESFGVVQGERLTEALVQLKLPWNRHRQWQSGPVALTRSNEPVSAVLDGGLKLTLLSPSLDQLGKLRGEWEKVCREEGLVAGAAIIERRRVEGLENFGRININRLAATEFDEDPEKPNGSSIAFIAEYDGRRVLFGADAHPTQLCTALAALGARQTLQAMKAPHHGSKRNLSLDLLAAVDCRNYLISTGGQYFNHPDREAIARIIKHGGQKPVIVFNYESAENKIWNSAGLREEWGYTPQYPQAGVESVSIDL